MNLKIPRDVKQFVRRHFAECNRSVSKNLTVFPAIQEESLDMNLLSYWSGCQQPVKLKSGWIVRFDAYFVGGGRHWDTWEIADIGVLIIFRKNAKVIRSKMAFLQSKKLYPNQLSYKKVDPRIVGFGMGRLLVPNEVHEEIVSPRLLQFKEDSRYTAFKKNDDQQVAMESFGKKFDMKLYYLFYNPLSIPHTAKVPVEGEPKLGKNKIGCRVVPKQVLDEALSDYPDLHSPSYGDVKYMLSGEFLKPKHDAGWRLEYFIVDLLLSCKEGVVDDSPNYEKFVNIFNARTRPMASSLSITIDAP